LTPYEQAVSFNSRQAIRPLDQSKENTMEKILITLYKQAEKKGSFNLSTLNRAIAYNNAHPMWKVTARQEAIVAYETITAGV